MQLHLGRELLERSVTGTRTYTKKCSFSLSPLPCYAEKVALANRKRFFFSVCHSCSTASRGAVLSSSRMEGLRSCLSKNPTGWCIQPFASLPNINHLSLSPGLQLCVPLCRSQHASQNPAGFILPKKEPKCCGGAEQSEPAHECWAARCLHGTCPRTRSNHCYLPFNFTSTGFYY